MKELLFISLLCFPLIAHAQSRNQQSADSLILKEIRSAWQVDSCGFGYRDSISNLLIERKSLYGLSENDIYFLFGKPINTIIYEDGKLVSYVIIGSYDRIRRKCNPNLVYKTLRIEFDLIDNKVVYYDAPEE